jgi:hypothetical protein
VFNRTVNTKRNIQKHTNNRTKNQRKSLPSKKLKIPHKQTHSHQKEEEEEEQRRRSVRKW